MMKTDTPETDEAEIEMLPPWEYARKLERERNEARKLAETMRNGRFSYQHFKDSQFKWEARETV